MVGIAAFVILFGFSGKLALSAQTEPIKLAMQPDAAITLKSMPIVSCIFDNLGHPVEYVTPPWRRAQKGIEAGDFDGFFVASRNALRDSYATASVPLMTSEWIYVVRHEQTLTPGNPAFKNLDFAANTDTARYRWLLSQKEQGHLSGNISYGLTAEDTWKMLVQKRFDVVLENGPNVRKILAGNQFDKRNFRYSLARKIPQSVYFGKKFLKQNPEFLKAFNKQVSSCK
jgi:polar amino acid transport system substrate-binding protein